MENTEKKPQDSIMNVESENQKPENKPQYPIVDIEGEKKKSKTAKIVKNVFVYIFLTICALLAFLPFYWMIITSIKTEGEFRQSVPTFFPQTFSFQNYSYVLTTGNNGLFGQMLLNTVVVGIISTIIGVVVTILTAYAFAKINFKGKNLLFTLMLATMMIPGELYTITNYVTVSNLGWKDTFVVLIVPFLVSTYYIYLLRNSFKTIPDSLYKAAKVDGVSEMGYLVKVMVPLTAPTLISITLLKFIGTWNSYIWPRLVNKTDTWRLISNWMTGSFTDPNGILGVPYSDAMYTLKMAAACMVSLPLFILFIFFRKYIMHGVSRSGTKG